MIRISGSAELADALLARQQHSGIRARLANLGISSKLANAWRSA
jgi:hypothetical protein